MSSSHPDPACLRLVTAPPPAAAAAARPPPARDSDWSVLMARAQDGDRDAYRRLLEEVTPYLRSLALRSHRDPRDIEDAIQDVLLTVHAVRHTYDPGRPFGPWLVAIARRRIVDRLRRQGRTRTHELPLDVEHETFAADEPNFQESADATRAVREAIRELPPRQREAVTLLKMQQMSLKEAAAASGMSIAALKVATHRALHTLRRLLGTDR